MSTERKLAVVVAVIVAVIVPATFVFHEFIIDFASYMAYASVAAVVVYAIIDYIAGRRARYRY